MTTEIYRHRIEHPIAWSGSDFRGKDAIAFDLSARQVTALEDIRTAESNGELQQLLETEGLPESERRRARAILADRDQERLMNSIPRLVVYENGTSVPCEVRYFKDTESPCEQ